MKKVSLIIPCYNEEQSLPYFYEELMKTVSGLSHKFQFQIVFIDDGSRDKTIQIVKKYTEQNEQVQYVSFSKNFGKEAAIYAGLQYSQGDYTAVMDADLQDPPSLLVDMLDILEKGDYDSVATKRITRKGEPILRSLFARAFYKIINKISDADIMDGARDFRLMNRNMVNAILKMSEYNRFSKGIFGWVGFKTKWLSYENKERVAGNTKWSFWKLFKYSINGIINFSQAPLILASFFGILFTLISFIMIIFIVVRWALFSDPVAGWTSLVCIIMLIGGIQLFCIGIMGQYLAKTYIEVKNRPIYIVRESNIPEENK